MRSPRKIVLDGAEGTEGRGLLLISALNNCAADLAGDQLRFVDVGDVAVRAAIELLRWETGLDVRVAVAADAPPGNSIFADANLYVAIAFRSKAHLHLEEAAFFGVPTLVAVQFPGQENLDPDSITLLRAAHDPRCFASRLVAMCGRP